MWGTYGLLIAIAGFIGLLILRRADNEELFNGNRPFAKLQRPTFLSDIGSRMFSFYNKDYVRGLSKQAGLPFTISPDLLIVSQLIIGGMLSFALVSDVSGIIPKLFVGILFFVIGAILPFGLILYMKSERQKNFLPEFYDFVESVTLGAESGLTIKQASVMALEESSESFCKIVEPIFSRIGVVDNLTSAFQAVHFEIGLEEVRFFVTSIIQSEKNRAPIVTSLRNYIDQQYETRRQKIERAYTVRQGVSWVIWMTFQVGPIVIGLLLIVGSLVISQIQNFQFH